MDEHTQDQILLDELFANERLIQHPTFGAVKLQRPNLRKERQIAEARRKQWHLDMQDKSVLSEAKLLSLASEEGAWSEEKSQQMEELKSQVTKLMILLESLGFQTPDEAYVEYQALVQKMRDSLTENPAQVEILDRYFDFDLEPDPADERALRKASKSTEFDEWKNAATELREQLELLYKLSEAKRQLIALQETYMRIVKDSKEARADLAEKMAKIYYCATREDGTPLWPTLEDMWDAPSRDMTFLDEELYFFMQGYSPEFRGMLGKHGFTARVPQTKPNEPSDDSLGHPQSSSNGESPENLPLTSSALPE